MNFGIEGCSDLPAPSIHPKIIGPESFAGAASPRSISLVGTSKSFVPRFSRSFPSLRSGTLRSVMPKALVRLGQMPEFRGKKVESAMRICLSAARFLKSNQFCIFTI